MIFFKRKENSKISNLLEGLDLFLLGISPENRKKLANAKEENNMFLYNDILFHALIHDDKQTWWHTDIWTVHER